jgi:hypothetical protein
MDFAEIYSVMSEEQLFEGLNYVTEGIRNNRDNSMYLIKWRTLTTELKRRNIDVEILFDDPPWLDEGEDELG